MSFYSEEPSLLRTNDLRSLDSESVPTCVPPGHNTIDVLDRQNQNLITQNKQLVQKLVLQKENSDLKTAAVLAEILKWFEKSDYGATSSKEVRQVLSDLRIRADATLALSRAPHTNRHAGASPTPLAPGYEKSRSKTKSKKESSMSKTPPSVTRNERARPLRQQDLTWGRSSTPTVGSEKPRKQQQKSPRSQSPVSNLDYEKWLSRNEGPYVTSRNPSPQPTLGYEEASTQKRKIPTEESIMSASPPEMRRGDGNDEWEMTHLTHGDVWCVKRDGHTIGKPYAAETESLTTSRPASLAASRPASLAASRPASLAASRPASLAASRPASLASSRPASLASTPLSSGPSTPRHTPNSTPASSRRATTPTPIATSTPVAGKPRVEAVDEITERSRPVSPRQELRFDNTLDPTSSRFGFDVSKWLLNDTSVRSTSPGRSDDGTIPRDGPTPTMEPFMEAPLEQPEKSCGSYSSPCDPISSRHAAKKNAMAKHMYPSRDMIQRIVGEIAFQLDRRILNYIFNGAHMEKPERKRFYGFTIGNIPEMIDMESRDPTSGVTNSKVKAAMAYRHKKVFHRLHAQGYRAETHAMFAVDIVNKYGLLSGPLEETLKAKLLTDSEWLRNIIRATICKKELKNVKVLLDCLIFMASDDEKPLFVW